MTKINRYDEYFLNRNPSKFSERYIYFWHKRMYEIADKMIENLRDKSLLEVGVGFGYFAQICRHKLLKNYSGLDMNNTMIDGLSSQGYDVSCATIPPFPDISQKVDIIWLSQVLEHATDYSNARAMLASAYKKLHKGGYVVIIVPDYLSWGKHFYDIDWSHGFPVTLKRLNQILSDVGFETVESKYHVATMTNDVIVTVLY